MSDEDRKLKPLAPKRSIQGIWAWSEDQESGEPPEPLVENEATDLSAAEESLDDYEASELDALGSELQSNHKNGYQEALDRSPNDENFDFWQGQDPNAVDSFSQQSGVGTVEEIDTELLEEETGFSRAELLVMGAVGAAVVSSAVVAETLGKVSVAEKGATKSPDTKKTVSEIRPRRMAKDYQTPKIPWLSQKKRGAKLWGYGFIMAIIFTIFGSITIATYMILLNSKVSVPTIVVNVSVISLLFFLLLLVARYVALIYMSFLHLSQSKDEEFDEVNQHESFDSDARVQRRVGYRAIDQGDARNRLRQL